MTRTEAKLHWGNPILDPGYTSDLVVIVSPYATAAGLRELFERIQPPSGLQLVTSWKADNLLSGSSDPEVYKILGEVGGRLYLHDRIHLKLYICSHHQAVLSTGNLTRNGLGFSASPNIEASSFVELVDADWRKITRLFSESQRVTDQIYEAATEFCEENRTPSAPAPVFHVPELIHTEAMFSWLSLPATPSPEALWEAYQRESPTMDPEDSARMAHDLGIYDIPENLSEHSFHLALGDAFRRHPFILALVGWLQQEGSASFGQVKAWLQENCSDRPTPYRWELTPATQALYEWLEFYHERLTWSRPSHSQVLKWSRN